MAQLTPKQVGKVHDLIREHRYAHTSAVQAKLAEMGIQMSKSTVSRCMQQLRSSDAGGTAAIGIYRHAAANTAVSELVANLLERQWFAESDGATQTDNTDRVLLLLVLCSADVSTLDDVVALNLGEVARCSGYSRRSFEIFFRRVTGESPARWFAKVRMYGAMRDLLSARPGALVADVATRWGFPHLSRFAGDYRAAFGELPGKTLRRATTKNTVD